MLDFRILGPLEVVDQEPLALGGHKQQAVLAVLLLHRGEAVAADRLIEAVWAGRGPATASKTLQVYISNMRKALGDLARLYMTYHKPPPLGSIAAYDDNTWQMGWWPDYVVLTGDPEVRDSCYAWRDSFAHSVRSIGPASAVSCSIGSDHTASLGSPPSVAWPALVDSPARPALNVWRWSVELVA